MTLKRRFYITLIITIILAVVSFVFKDVQSEVPIFINTLLGGVILYMLFFYLLETGKLKVNWTKRLYRNIIYGLSILILIYGITLANEIDESENSIWVINHNLWLVDALSFLLASLIFYIIFSWFFEQWKAIQTLKNEKAKAELSLLKNQINPHFFFNTLNNLYSLIKKDPDTAQNYVLKLSDMMRFTIYGSENDMVTLEEEIAYLTNYIELQTARYHKKIDINFSQEVNNPTTKVNPLLFIILLENTFKHGVEKLIDDVFITIKMIEKEGAIIFIIKNNYDAEVTNDTNGIGLKNLRDRLNLLYPNKHKFEIEYDDTLFTARLELLKI